MTDYRRLRTPGGTVFFTVNLLERKSRLLIEQIDLLREVVRSVRQRQPFHVDAWVVMPDHMHTMWTLPENDSDYSSRWQSIKKEFSKRLPATERRSLVRQNSHERGIWQRRFWEHTIRDDADYASHFDYIHFNPVKHGWVQQPSDWLYSSFHRAVSQGLYPGNWYPPTEMDFPCGE